VRDGLADHGAQGCNVRGAYEASQQYAGQSTSMGRSRADDVDLGNDSGNFFRDS
jgi:hypothetical protein